MGTIFAEQNNTLRSRLLDIIITGIADNKITQGAFLKLIRRDLECTVNEQKLYLAGNIKIRKLLDICNSSTKNLKVKMTKSHMCIRQKRT